MKKFAFISDLIFTFCVSFLFTACFFRFLRLPLFLALLLSAVCGALTACAVGALLYNRRKKGLMKKKDAETKDKLLVHLSLLSKEKLTNFFLEYFQKQHLQNQNADPSTEKPTPQRHANLQITVGDIRYFLRFRFAPVTADDVTELFRVKTKQTKVLLCGNIDAQAKALCEKLEIQTRTGDEIYTVLKQADALPQAYLGEKEKTKRKFHPKLWFSKTNARRFLTSGAMILLIAYITPFFYYYLIFGSLLLIAAILIRVFGYE